MWCNAFVLYEDILPKQQNLLVSESLTFVIFEANLLFWSVGCKIIVRYIFESCGQHLFIHGLYLGPIFVVV